MEEDKDEVDKTDSDDFVMDDTAAAAPGGVRSGWSMWNG
jgi:hypothetical protein